MKRQKNDGAQPEYLKATALLLAACLVIALLGLRSSRSKAPGDVSSRAELTAKKTLVIHEDAPSESNSFRAITSTSGTAEAIVASKVTQFSRSRREIVRAISLKAGKDVPAEIEEFFDALEKGNWAEIDRRFGAMAKRSGQYDGSTHDPELNPFWPAVLEAYGAAEQAHLWPAQQLLDYGEAILGSLRPGMVYIGGSDPGRFIPTLLNATGEGEPHIVLTQNALADSRYLEYLRFQYSDRFGFALGFPSFSPLQKHKAVEFELPHLNRVLSIKSFVAGMRSSLK